MLSSCGPEQAGEPVTRTEIGSGINQVSPSSDAVAQAPGQTDAESSPCSEVRFADVTMLHCIADPQRHRVTMQLGPKGDYYRSFARLSASRGADAAPVAFAVNGGMFDEAGAPIGYYVEDGARRRELNRAEGAGNFHLMPNGVFHGSETSWHVRTTEEFYATVSDRPAFGTQSGPMLLIGGELHPEFQEDGPSRMIRNGVGVDREGRAHFVMSQGGISFGRFAVYFRDVAKTPDALYLDGNVSGVWVPSRDRMDARVPIGPMIVVEEKE